MEGTVSAERTVQRVSLEEEVRALAERERLNEALHDYSALRKKAAMSVESAETRQEKVWRERVTDWFYKVVDQVELERDMVYVAMNMLDRFLAVIEDTESYLRDQKKYRLAAMTCLLLSLKMCGSNAIGLGSLVKMSSGSVTQDQVLSCAKTIVRSLSWTRPLATPAAFLAKLSHILPSHSRQSVLHHATFLVELSLYDPFFQAASPSDIAIAALLNAQSITHTTRAQAKHFLTSAASLTSHTNLSNLLPLRKRLNTAFLRASPASDHTNNPSIPTTIHTIPSVPTIHTIECRIVSSDDMTASQPSSKRRKIAP